MPPPSRCNFSGSFLSLFYGPNCNSRSNQLIRYKKADVTQDMVYLKEVNQDPGYAFQLFFLFRSWDWMLRSVWPVGCRCLTISPVFCRSVFFLGASVLWFQNEKKKDIQDLAFVGSRWFHEIFFCRYLVNTSVAPFHQRPSVDHNCIITDGSTLPLNKVMYSRHEYHMVIYRWAVSSAKPRN